MKEGHEPPRRTPGLSEAAQEPIHHTPFFSRSSSERPGALESQEDYEKFVAHLRGKIAHKLTTQLDPDVQTEIAILMRLLATMRRTTVDRNRVHFETVFDLLASDSNNLTIIRSLRFSLTVAAERESRGVTGIILYFAGNTSMTAVLAALWSILLLLLLMVLILMTGHTVLGYIDRQLEEIHPLIHALSQFPIGELIILFISSFLGSVVSVLTRIRTFLSRPVFQPLMIYVSVITKPFVSLVFAFFVYAVVKGGLVSFSGVDLSGPSAPYVVWVLGFLSGFSERFSQDFVAGAESTLASPLGGTHERSPPAPPS